MGKLGKLGCTGLSQGSYWVAYRYYYYNGNEGGWHKDGLSFVNGSGVFGNAVLVEDEPYWDDYWEGWDKNTYTRSRTLGVRPIIRVPSDYPLKLKQ